MVSADALLVQKQRRIASTVDKVVVLMNGSSLKSTFKERKSGHPSKSERSAIAKKGTESR